VHRAARGCAWWGASAVALKKKTQQLLLLRAASCWQFICKIRLDLYTWSTGKYSSIIYVNMYANFPPQIYGPRSILETLQG
jgi:hypothetical protein